MSPLAKNIAKQIQDVVSSARPGLVRVYVVVAEYADDSVSANEPAARQMGQEEDVDETGVNDIAPASGFPNRRDGEGVVSYVQRVRRERGQIALKCRDWAPRVALSVNEIERAMAEGALAYDVKDHARDHGAKMIGVGAMLQYVTTIDAVERGAITPPPVWWAAVRKVKSLAA